jgi:hypothetical protein
MALQRINWTQIDSSNVPSGTTVNLGSLLTSLDGVFTNELYIEGINFFDYLTGYTPSTGITHSDLHGLEWIVSGHIGTPNKVAGFDSGGNPVLLPSGGTVNNVEDNTGLGLTGDTLYTIYNTTLDPELEVPNSVGGITSGTTVSQLTGKTIVEIIDDLLFPIALPSYTIPTITMTGVTSQTLEAGVTYAVGIGMYGDKNDAGAFTRLRILRNSSPIFTDITLGQSSITDIPEQFGYTDPNNPNYRYSTTPASYSESYVIPTGTTTYNGDGNYGAGVAKQDNKGNYDTRTPAVRSTSAPQAASTGFSTATYTITGLYPYFYGLSDTLPTVDTIASAISGGTATKVLSSASGTLTIPYNNPTEWKYIWFAYVNNYTTKTIWYVNALDNGEIDGSFISTVATRNVNSPDGYWSGKIFKMHWSVYPTKQNTIEFRNS